MKTTEEMIEVLTAYKQGKVIEAKHKDDNTKWYVPTVPCWDWSNYDYRIKSESKYRPFKDIDELANYWCQKYGNIAEGTMPLIWIRNKEDKNVSVINQYDFENNMIFAEDYIGFPKLLDEYTFIDGTPCGAAE